MTETDSVLVERDGPVTIVSINRPHCRNAVDGATARKLYDAFLAFDADEAASVAVFTGTGDLFAALLAAARVGGSSTPEALSHAASAIFAVLERTAARGTEEMRIVESAAQLVNPQRKFECIAIT